MCTSLGLLFSGLGGVIVGAIIGYFSQKKLLGIQIAAATDSTEKLLRRMGEQIDLQVKAAEVSSIGNLLHSVNTQLGAAGPTGPIDSEKLKELLNARGLYHGRLHERLREMGRGF